MKNAKHYTTIRMKFITKRECELMNELLMDLQDKTNVMIYGGKEFEIAVIVQYPTRIDISLLEK